MGFLNRLFGNSQQMSLQLTNFSRQRPDAELDIVGEASYQEAIEKVAGQLGPNGATVTSQTAVLVREPNNPKDANAIAVYLLEPADPGTMQKVGYIARELAPGYGAVFGMLGGNGIMAPARLKGGWRRGPNDFGSFGVVLNLGSPGELAVELFLDQITAPQGHRWSGQMVCFTGASGFAIGPVALDRPGQEYLARATGCTTWPRITKKVQVCVTSSPDAETGKLVKAEEYGLEVVAEWDFWPGVGLQLERRARW